VIGADGVFTRCTFSGNYSANYGGAIIFSGNTLRLSNCTISNNYGSSGAGGIYNTGNTVEVTNCTIANNTGHGGVSSNGGITRLRNTIIANNTLPNLVASGSATIVSLGNNLTSADDWSGLYLNQSSDKINTDPLLAPLGNYGGATQTLGLLTGSPAINAGNNCVLTNNCVSNNLGFNLITDQRGAGFNRQMGSAVDIGAFESRFTIAVFTGASTAAANERTSNSTYTFADTIAGNSTAQTFTIKNTGTANLTGIAVTITGAHPTDFLLNAAGATTLAPNATMTFTVSFKPLWYGVRNAVINIASNEVDPNPFVINVRGTGVNSLPTITASNLTRQQSNPSTNLQIATVMDAQDPEQILGVTVNGAISATVNGVTISNLTVNTSGQVRADVAASCTATNASFTLTVRDYAGGTANATLNVTVTANAAPTVGNYSNTLLAPGGTTMVIPSASPADNGSIASVTATATPNFFTGTLTGNTATGALTITNANPVGGYTITITVKDNCGATTTRSFMLTVSTCGASLSKTGQSFAANGGTGNFTVTIGSACTWTAVSNNPSFITIVSPQGQQAGTGTVSFNVGSHSNTTPRSGTITVAGQTFIVQQGAQFLDVPVGAPFYEEIGKLSAAGVTQGCGGGNYCPAPAVTREQMAVFLIRALGDFNPPAPGAQRFADVPESNPFYAFIEQMAVRGITSGCGGGNYCPTANVTREQMAAFIIRALHDPGYVPPAPGAQRFADVPWTNPFYGHIEEMAVRAITLGCGGGNYCPTSDVTRGQMAAFLVRAFGL
jgi:hypothetical protein